MTQSELLERLESEINELLKHARTHYATQTREALHLRPGPEKWSVVEHFAHLNAHLDYFLPQIERALHKAKARRWSPDEWRHSNWFGKRLLRAVDPATAVLHPRRSPKAIDPAKTLSLRDNESKVLLINLELLLRYVRQAREVDINRPRLKPLRWRMFSLLLGDGLEYLVLHVQRHFVHADQILALP